MKRIFLCIVSGLITLAASALDLKVTPGTLRNELPALTSTTDETVRISGEANVTDLILLRELPAGVRTLDLSGLQIVAYTYQQGGYMNRLSYEANEIPPYMLFGTHISKLTLPAGVTRIGDAAFGLTPLDSFTTPATLETLGDYAFSGCTDLKEVEFTRPVILGKGAFRNCRNLIRVRFGYDPLEIPASFFEGCSSLQTGVPASVSIVGERAYRGAGLSEVDLSNVSTVGDYAFADMKVLRNIIIPRSHDVVYGIGAFSNDPELNDLSDWAGNIPDLLLAHSSTSGRNNVFLNTPEIGEGAFANNMSIDSLRLGKAILQSRDEDPLFFQLRKEAAITLQVDSRHQRFPPLFRHGTPAPSRYSDAVPHHTQIYSSQLPPHDSLKENLSRFHFGCSNPLPAPQPQETAFP